MVYRFLMTAVLVLATANVFASVAFAQDGLIVKKMPKSKNFDIPDDVTGEVRKLLEECESEMDLRRTDKKNFKQHQEKFLKAAKRAASRAPKCALAQFYLCVAYQGDGKDKPALQAIAKGLKLKPDFYELEVEKADILVRQDKDDQALKIYDRVIKEHPDYYYAYEAKLNLMAKQKKWKEALELLNNVLSSPHTKETDKNLKEFKRLLKSEVNGLNLPHKAEGKHYVVETDASREYADEILKHAELIYKAYNKVFKSSKKPGEKFPITIFATPQGYYNYGGGRGSRGFFNPTLGRVVFIKSNNPDTFTTVLYHELFHQFLCAQKVKMPYWFNEGHADFFGGFKYNQAKNQMVCYVQKLRLDAARKHVRSASLKELLMMNRDDYYNPRNSSRNYALGWSFVYFLWRAENGKYISYVKKYYSMMKKKKYSLKEMCQKVFAKNITTLEKAWKSYVAKGCK